MRIKNTIAFLSFLVLSGFAYFSLPAFAQTSSPQAPTVSASCDATNLRIMVIATATSMPSQGLIYTILRDGIAVNASTQTTTSSYFFPDVPPAIRYNTKYSYQAYVKDSTTLASSTLSAVASVECPLGSPIVTAQQGSANLTVNLSWGSIAGASYYRIARKDSAGTTLYTASTTATSFGDSVPSAGTYYYEVVAVDEFGSTSKNPTPVSVSITSTTPSTSDTLAPSAPTNLVATTSTTGYAVKLSWAASMDNVRVSYYQVVRASGGSWSATTTALSIADSSITSPGGYSYQVYAYDSAGNKSAGSNIATVNFPTTASLPAPATFTATGATSSVSLAWSSVSEANAYRIERSGPSGSSTKTVTGSSYQDTGLVAGTHTYKIFPVSGGTISPNYATASANVAGGSDVQTAQQTIDTTAPSAPTNLVATTSTTGYGVNLSWAASTDTVGVSYYEIRRATSSTMARLAATTFVKYADTSIVTAGTYSYQIFAYDAAGNMSAPSNIVSITFPSVTQTSQTTTTTQTTPPPTPFVLRVVQASGTLDMIVSWSTSTDAVKYRIFRTGSSTANFDVSAPSSTLVDRVPSPGSYGYSVAAFNASGVSSLISPVYYLTAQAVSTTTANKPPSVPQNLTLAWDLASSITLKWSSSFDDVAVAGYRVFRNNIIIATTSATSTQYTDGKISAGATYTYEVSAYDEKDYESSRSSQKSFTVPSIVGSSTLQDASSTLVQASGTIAVFVSGVAKDDKGQPLSDAFVDFSSTDGKFQKTITTDLSGAYGVYVPQGAYVVVARPIIGRDDIVPALASKYDVRSQEDPAVFTIDIVFVSAQKKITGRVSYADGSPVGDARVEAYSASLGKLITAQTNSSGTYSLLVGAGNWNVSLTPLNPLSAGWYYPESEYAKVFFATSTGEQTMLKNFTVRAKASSIVVDIRGKDEAAIPGALIIAQNISDPALVYYSQSQTDGVAKISVPAGKYRVQIKTGGITGYLPVDEQTADASALGSEVKLVFVLEKAIENPTINLRGIVRTGNGTPVSAAIFARSTKGASVQIVSGSKDGAFSATMPADSSWQVAAAGDLQGVPFRSSEMSVVLNRADKTIEIVVVSASQTKLPDPVRVVQDPSRPAVAQLTGGAAIAVPGGTIDTGRSMAVQMTPTSQAPSLPGARVIGSAYDITLLNSQGESVRSLKKEVEIIMPYTVADLKRLKVSEDALIPSYFDESNGTWIKLDSYVIDKINKKIIAKSKHLTRFAIVAPADSVPPAAPTKIAVRKSTVGPILSWTKPIADFDHVKIYRSAKRGVLGSVILAETRSTFAIDGRVASGTTYWYTVRAVDAAGNESGNTAQVPATAGPVAAADKAFARQLQLGSSGNDVSLLQQILIEEDVFPEASVSGVYGATTKAAVARLQQKYASELLVPLKLAKGNGIVNATTRKKLNEINKSIATQFSLALQNQ